MKKTFLFGMMMVAMATTAFAGTGEVGSVGGPASSMTFSLRGIAHPTTAADGVLLKGTQADVLYDSLAVPENMSPGSDGKVKQKIVPLDPRNSVLGCYRDLVTSETECYMGKFNQ